MSAVLQTEIKSHHEAAPDMVVPIARNISPPEFELERSRIFGRAWLMVAHADEVRAAGDYVIRNFHAPQASVLIVRGDDGVVRAFHNICRHRGNALVRGDAPGHKPRISCGFHGWTWSTTGVLRGVTDESQFVDLDKSTLDLLPVHCEIWNGLVFLNFADEPEETLREWMGELADGWDGYFEGQHKLSSHRFELETNWNLGVNAFTEGYHTLYIHRNTAGDYQGGRSNPQRHRPFMQFMKRHTRYSAPANPDHKLAPAEALAYAFGRKLLPAACFENDSLPAAVNPSRAAHWLFDVVELFPNVVMLIGQHYRIEITFLPVSASRSIVINETFVYKAQNLAERVGQELFGTREREVVREDLSLLEAQQAAISNGAQALFHLSRQEMAIAHHYKVRQAMLECH